MPLDLVTFTGPDDRTDPAALVEIARRYPRVEWGVLSSPKRSGGPRCPTDAWVSRFVALASDVRKALHVADGDVDAYIAGDAALLAKAAPFDRVQINFDQSRAPRSLDALEAALRRPGPTPILQHHDGNAAMIDALAARGARFVVLFDASSGKGVRPQDWLAPLPGIECGYAGGLGPKTIGDELPRITAVTGERRFWIDMASSVRDPADDRFDLARCEAVLAHAFGPR